MDKLEYIPGDLVMTKTEPNDFTPNGVVCEFVSYCNRNKVFVRVAKGIDTFFLEKEQIIPIPITQEILEKNVWEATKESLGHSFKNKKYPRFALWSINDKWNFTIDGVMVCNTLSCLCYVHELQHLLFGLNINHEMEV